MNVGVPGLNVVAVLSCRSLSVHVYSEGEDFCVCFCARDCVVLACVLAFGQSLLCMCVCVLVSF